LIVSVPLEVRTISLLLPLEIEVCFIWANDESGVAKTRRTPKGRSLDEYIMLDEIKLELPDVFRIKLFL
jgi:hypothetical protein